MNRSDFYYLKAAMEDSVFNRIVRLFREWLCKQLCVISDKFDWHLINSTLFIFERFDMNYSVADHY